MPWFTFAKDVSSRLISIRFHLGKKINPRGAVQYFGKNFLLLFRLFYLGLLGGVVRLSASE